MEGSPLGLPRGVAVPVAPLALGLSLSPSLSADAALEGCTKSAAAAAASSSLLSASQRGLPPNIFPRGPGCCGAASASETHCCVGALCAKEVRWKAERHDEMYPF